MIRLFAKWFGPKLPKPTRWLEVPLYIPGIQGICSLRVPYNTSISHVRLLRLKLQGNIHCSGCAHAACDDCLPLRRDGS